MLHFYLWENRNYSYSGNWPNFCGINTPPHPPRIFTHMRTHTNSLSHTHTHTNMHHLHTAVVRKQITFFACMRIKQKFVYKKNFNYKNKIKVKWTDFRSRDMKETFCDVTGCHLLRNRWNNFIVNKWNEYSHGTL